MPSCALPASALQVGTTMGRGPQLNPAFTKVFAEADRGLMHRSSDGGSPWGALVRPLWSESRSAM